MCGCAIYNVDQLYFGSHQWLIAVSIVILQADETVNVAADLLIFFFNCCLTI